MTPAERLHKLEQALRQSGSLRLRDAAALLGVSEMTVRRDLARHPGTLSYLGGHIVAAHSLQNAGQYSVAQEKDHFAQAKQRASQKALALIAPHDVIFIDCGTTLLHLARLIPDSLPLTVVCYSLNTADILKNKPAMRLIVLGGTYMSSSDSFSGQEALNALDQLSFDTAFMSAGGVDDHTGVSCWNLHEKDIKRRAMQRAKRRYLVVDSSKLGVRRHIRFADLNEFDTILTEQD